METESTLMENMTEEQQMQVFTLMNMANIEDINFAAQMLAQFNFDLDVQFCPFSFTHIFS